MTALTLDHLVFAVRELQGAAGAWAMTFGLRAEPAYQPEGVPLEIALLPIAGAGDRGAFLELVRATDDHRVSQHIDRWGEGMLSMSLEVADLDAAVRELRGKGVSLSDIEPGLLPNSRVARFDANSAHGVALQLIEREAKAASS